MLPSQTSVSLAGELPAGASQNHIRPRPPSHAAAARPLWPVIVTVRTRDPSLVLTTSTPLFPRQVSSRFVPSKAMPTLAEQFDGFAAVNWRRLSPGAAAAGAAAPAARLAPRAAVNWRRLSPGAAAAGTATTAASIAARAAVRRTVRGVVGLIRDAGPPLVRPPADRPYLDWRPRASAPSSSAAEHRVRPLAREA